MNVYPHHETEIAASAPKCRSRIGSYAAIAFGLLSCAGCGNAFDDNGTHLAYAIEKGAQQLRASNAPEFIVKYQTLDKLDDAYYVEITPSIAAGSPSRIWGSYLVVSGKTSGGTSYHNRFVFVPERLYLQKNQGGSTEVVLRKDGNRVSVVDLR
jgi:hypothetical protein